MRQMTTFGSLLGLDPSSRSRIIGGGKAQTIIRLHHYYQVKL